VPALNLALRHRVKGLPRVWLSPCSFSQSCHAIEKDVLEFLEKIPTKNPHDHMEMEPLKYTQWLCHHPLNVI